MEMMHGNMDALTAAAVAAGGGSFTGVVTGVFAAFRRLATLLEEGLRRLEPSGGGGAAAPGQEPRPALHES